jgi:hypothetical protein
VWTLNYGLRWDYVKQRVVGQKAQSGRFAQSAAYDDIPLPVWSDLSPRLSVVYDLSGNGKTAVRAGFNKVRHRADDGLRAALQPDGADDAAAAVG